MTNRECLKKMHQKVIDAFSKLLKADEELFAQGNGFIDKKFIDAHYETYKNWQDAQNEFNKFLSFILKEKRGLDDEIGI
ncbi:MAG: hypothetical protein HY063_00990 [Bacteroidetes bacterium]|nr:hypothetical protein [Bacteroidota bacterium]